MPLFDTVDGACPDVNASGCPHLEGRRRRVILPATLTAAGIANSAVRASVSPAPRAAHSPSRACHFPIIHSVDLMITVTSSPTRSASRACMVGAIALSTRPRRWGSLNYSFDPEVNGADRQPGEAGRKAAKCPSI